MIYLATPYFDPDPAVRQWRFEAACKATAQMLRAGLIVFSPIAHSHPLTRYGLPGDWKFWHRYDRAHLEACSAMAVLTLEGWQESKGVQAEIRIAHELNMPFWLMKPESAGVTAKPNIASSETIGAEEDSRCRR